ncbi:MAG: FtsQ-type POTRA domain-containing protein [Hydrogenibacillus sp.]|nr:FtsQ-type POTRA domain-containing protein [Hydrogenibacillus sp.]
MRRLALLFFVLLVVLAFLRSPYSRFQTVDVQGAVRLQPETVEDIAGVHPGDAIFIRPQAVRGRLLDSGEFVEARVHYRFPNRLLLEVREARPVAMSADGGLWLETGVFSRRGKVPTDVVWFGGSIDERTAEALARSLGGFPASVYEELSEITFDTEKDRLHVFLQNGDEVVVAPEDFERLMPHVPELLAAVPDDARGRLYLLGEGSYFVSYERLTKNGEGQDADEKGKPPSRVE